jgi:MFS family permease
MGGISGLAAVFHFRRSAHPLLDLATLRIASFVTTSVGSGTVFRIAVAATHFLLPLLFQVAFGLSPLEAGGLVLIYFAGNLAAKPATSPLLRRWGFRRVLIVNGVANALAIGALALLGPTTVRPLLWTLLFAAGLVRSLQFTALTTLAFADVPETRRGSAATLMSMFSQIGICLGVSAAAVLLDSARSVQSTPGLQLLDFQVAFGVMGLVALCAVAGFARLDPDAGCAVSGAKRRGEGAVVSVWRHPPRRSGPGP